jgi:hypothetical protein
MKDPGETYGFTGFGGFNGSSENAPFAPVGSGLPDLRQGNNYSGQRPMVTRKEIAGPRVPIKLGQTSGNANAGPPQTQRPGAGEKRKSWFGKRFSKAG